MKEQTQRYTILISAILCLPFACFAGESGSTDAVKPAPQTGYRNVALNPHAAKGGYPKATTNSQFNTTSFAAHNVINGNKKNKGHGGGFPSWGPHKRDDLWLKIDFGKEVEVDKSVICVRADFKPYRPRDHDSWWKSGVMEFSDGSKVPFELKKTADGQVVKFAKRKASWVKFTDLVPAEDRWCGFSELEIWGQ